MKKVLFYIRSKPPKFRMTLSFVLAFVCTAGIAALMIWTNRASYQPKTAPDAPSPFAALGQTIKTVVKDSDFKSQMGQGNTTSPEIIDAGAVSSEHDETNPYQDSVQ